MKKSLLLLMLMAFLLPWALNAQTLDATLCDGTATNGNVPMYTSYCDEGFTSEYIVPASAFENENIYSGSQLHSITLYQSSTSAWVAKDLTIKLTNTETEAYLSASLLGSSGTTVYTNASYSANSAESHTFEFSSSFEYTGGSLIVQVSAASGGTWKSSSWYGTNTTTNQGYYIYGSYTGSLQKFIPKTAFNYTPGAAPANPKPTNFAVSNILHNQADLSWNENGSATSWQICVNDDETNLITTNDNPYTLIGLTPQTAYTVKVRSVGSENSEWSSVVNFSTTAVATPVGNSWSDDFEGDACGWDLINGTLSNKWVWGTAANNGTGTHALYISNDDGATNAYSTGSAAAVYATKLLEFAGGKYEFSYDWLCYGESTYDYLRVVLAPASAVLTAGTSLVSGLSTTTVPTGWIALDGGGKLNLLTAWASKTVSVDVTAGNYYLVLAWRNDGSSGSQPPAAVDNVSIVKMACPYDVEDLDASSITTTSATLTWTAGDATQWQVAYGTASDFEGATEQIVSAASINLTELQHSTVYYVKVRAYCGGSDYGSWSNVISFATECEALDLDQVASDTLWFENFDRYTAAAGFLPVCWNRINECSYAYYSASNYPRIYADGYYTYANSAPNCLYLYSYAYYSSGSTSYDPQPQYAILPEMSNLAGKQITLQARGYDVNSTFKIGTMADPSDVTTFVAIATQSLTTSYQEFTYNIPSDATAHYVAIMIEAANSTRSTNSVYIDDIVIANPPACPKPTDLAVNASGQTATLTWVSGATEFNIAHATSATAIPDENIVGTASTNSFEKSSLALDADHYFWVQTNCGSDGNSVCAGPVSVHFGYCVPAPTSVDNSGISNVTFGTGAEVVNNNNHPSAAPYYGDYTAQIGAVQAGVEATIAITYKTSYSYNTYVWVDLDNDLSFEANEVVAYGESTSSNPTTLTLNFTIPATQATGDYRLRIGGADSGLGSDPAKANPCYTGTYGIFEDYTLRVLEAPACLVPSGLAINYTGGTEAEISFNSEATAWNLDVNGTVTAITQNPYTLSGLELGTTYEVKLQTNCGENNLSDWTAAVSFKTDPCMPEDQCILSFELTDDYGDGWEDGAALNIVDAATNDIIESLTLTSGASKSGTVRLCSGLEVNFVWVNGVVDYYDYNYESGYSVTDANGVVICSHVGGSSSNPPTAGVVANYVVCSFLLNINASGYATFYDEARSYELPADLTGHVFSTQNTPMLVQVYDGGDVVPASTPLVMKAGDGVTLPKTFALLPATGGSGLPGGVQSQLEGVNVDSAAIETSNNHEFFVLSLNGNNDAGSIGFYYYSSTTVHGGFPLEAHKAYLKVLATDLPADAPSAFFLFNGENGATWLENLEGVEGTLKFLHEGKIFILREGVIYDATGRKVMKL